MGCPCEILLDTTDASLADQQLNAAIQEAARIENKYSRYRKDTIIDRINRSAGERINVDDETAALLDFAAQCYDMSEGLFDITTGILRKNSDLTRIGWDKVSWERPYIQLPSGFEIDLGGVCKEYAADKILELLIKRHPLATLVNLGGDIAAAGDRLWSVGIEDVRREGEVAKTVQLRKGGIATSGTTKRAGHILNPKTAQPVANAPESVTVAAKTCTEAGFWSTLAVLKGAQAESFLTQHSLESWCYRVAPEAQSK
jgi:thiamine biosynthesis lipoprotein